MAEFSISTEICLGYHCCGSGEYTEGSGTVELSEEQVRKLVSLIRENGGETDIEVLGLEDKLPDVYEALSEAYGAIVLAAARNHWLIEGYWNRCFDEPEGLMERLEGEGIFKFEPDINMMREELGLDDDEDPDEDDLEDAKREAFDEWLDDYVSGLDDQAAFLEEYYGADVDEGYPDEYQYETAIPSEIVAMANSKED